jgi:hypothetical protein
MNWAWWDGKMPVEHYKEEHGLDTGALGDLETSGTEATDTKGGVKPPAKSPQR